jgi:hypothetical protein
MPRRLRLAAAVPLLLALAAVPPPAAAQPAAEEDFPAWPLLRNPFPSTGGGGVMIDGYDPVLEGRLCRTAFTATLPDGTVYRNRAEFDAVPVQGGILCTSGRWQAADGSASGTTPFRLFLRDGVVRRAP